MFKSLINPVSTGKKLFLIFFIALMIFSCSKDDRRYKNYKTSNIHKPKAWGQLQTVYVFADNDIWNKAKTVLEKSLAKVYFTTEDEKYFEVKRAEYKNIEQFYKYNNLIFLADLKSDGEVSDHVKSIMQQSTLDNVKTNGAGIYPTNNLWANDQIVSFIIADSPQNLTNIIQLQNAKIFEIFKSKLYARIKERVYRRDLYTAKAFSQLPWTMDITKNYILYKEGKGFTSFMNRIITKPDKYVSVYYEYMPQNNVDEDWMRKMRAKIGLDYYEGDAIDSMFVNTQKDKIAGYDCYKMYGRWQNTNYYIGGAFQCYAFYDEKNKIAYLIDNSVYYPDGYKLLSLIELEVMSNTFKIKNNIQTKGETK